MKMNTNLPLELSSLLGRDNDLTALRQRVQDHRLITLTGPGGTGNAVDLRGHEEWTFEANGRILESRGHYDEVEYEHDPDDDFDDEDEFDDE